MSDCVIPFLWHHGEPNEIIKREITTIKNCGINAFCVESRPHPDFCGEKWWQDFDFILDFAQRLDMRVWLLDDKSYPSGIAAGKMYQYPHLKPRAIKATHIDFYSDNKAVNLILTHKKNDTVLSCFVFKRTANSIRYCSGQDISNSVCGAVATTTQLNGYYRAVALIEYTEEKSEYIDMLNPQSVELMLNYVYKPHYKRYKDKFGKTFMGFFTDEPAFRNIPSHPDWVKQNMYQNTLGIMGMAYPWSNEVKNELGTGINLVALWYDIGRETAEIRYKYMNTITRLYSANYSDRLGDYCISHGVSFMGHVVEDMGAHTRLGAGAGHFFRSMSGQDYAGIDVVLHQIKPYFNNMSHIYPTPSVQTDPDFFCFTLAKLAASAAVIQPIKSGRAMCEIFGAYGYGEDIADMRYLINFMLVRGINTFVPHAFNAKQCDTDCPPHFSEHGNVQLEAFSKLMINTQEICDMIKNHNRFAEVAVLYHAEAEWSGREYHSCDKIVKQVLINQRDIDILPEDEFSNAVINKSCFKVNERSYKCLIVPYRNFYTQSLKNSLDKLVDNGVAVLYCDKFGKVNNQPLINSVNRVCPAKIWLKNTNQHLRIAVYEGESTILMLFNEGAKPIKTTLFHSYKNHFSWHCGTCITAQTDGKIVLELDSSEFCILTSKGNGTVYVKKTQRRSLEFLPKIVKKDSTTIYQLSANFNGENYIEAKCNNGALKLFANNNYIGIAIGKPYGFNLSNPLYAENDIRLEHYATLALKRQDEFSVYAAVPDTGLTGLVCQKNLYINREK